MYVCTYIHIGTKNHNARDPLFTRKGALKLKRRMRGRNRIKLKSTKMN
jgi:hypothetical protein